MLKASFLLVRSAQRYAGHRDASEGDNEEPYAKEEEEEEEEEEDQEEEENEEDEEEHSESDNSKGSDSNSDDNNNSDDDREGVVTEDDDDEEDAEALGEDQEQVSSLSRKATTCTSQRGDCTKQPTLKRSNNITTLSTSRSTAATPLAVHFQRKQSKLNEEKQKQKQHQKQHQKKQNQKQKQHQPPHAEEQLSTPAVCGSLPPPAVVSATSIQCRSLNTNEDRCKRFTRHGYTCFYHLRKEMGLVVKQSTLPRAGLGLFTVWPRVKGERIVAYEGEHIISESLYSGPYVLQLNQQTYIDAKDPFCGVGRYANCCRTGDKGEGSCRSNNTHLAIDRASKTASIIATRSIAAGEEVLCAYGQSYW
jgi:hypothetical protein